MDKKTIWILVIILIIGITILKKQAGTGICSAIACDQYQIDTWVYKDPSVAPFAIGSCCVVSEGESHTICTGSVWTELYLTCCANDCSSGSTRCDETYVQTCGNYDADSCLEWGNDIFCEYGCLDGVCVVPTYSDFLNEKDSYLLGSIDFDTFISNANRWL